MENIRPHKKLKIWEKIMVMIEKIYRLSKDFPRSEVYGLSSQMRRAAVSVASNIAEGAARKGKREKIQFFSISKGSLSELDAQVEIALRLSYIIKDKYSNVQSDIDEVSRMLEGLIRSVKK